MPCTDYVVHCVYSKQRKICIHYPTKVCIVWPYNNQRKIHGLLLNKLIMIMPDKSLSLLAFTSHIDCTISNFKNGSLSDSNFDTIGMEETYSDGKQVIVPCKLGFTGFFKIKCSSGHWTKVLGAICTRKFILVFVVYIFTMLKYKVISTHR